MHYRDEIRERYETPDMEPGEAGRGTKWALVLAVAMLISALPVWREATSGHGEVLERLQPLSEEGVEEFFALNRALQHRIETIETGLEEGSPLRRLTLPAVQWAQLRWGGVGNETVYAGRSVADDGWLVFRPGFDHLVGRPFLDPDVLERRRRGRESWKPPLHPDPRPALLDLRRRLAERGIELLLLPVPTKPAIHPEVLADSALEDTALVDTALEDTALENRTPANPSLAAFLADMEDAGLHVLDPAPLLRDLAQTEDAYLRTDSHWSPSAVEAVARALAETLESVVELPPPERNWVAGEIERRGRGDLWHLLELPSERPIYRQETIRVREITDRSGLLWAPSRNAPILLLGDSFTNVYSVADLHWGRGAGLAEQLAHELGRDVDRIAIQDGSSDQVRRELARNPRRLDGKRIVVYQFATRELSFGDWPVY